MISINAHGKNSPAQSNETPGQPVIVTLTDTSRSAIFQYAQLAADGRETGGILLGHHHERPEQTLDVVYAGDAGPNAVRQIAAFRRDVEHAQALADLAYSTDGSTWLGEWHTHPDDSGRPSCRDLASYRRMLSEPDLAFHVFLAIIALPDRGHGWQRPRLTGWVVSIANAWSAPLRRRTYREGTSP